MHRFQFNRFPPCARASAACCTLALGLCITSSVYADTPIATVTSQAPAAPAVTPSDSAASWWQQAQQEVLDTWNSGQNALYVPLHTWHNRRMYPADKIAEYNENPWGIGAGKERYDQDGNWHSLYVMEFADSHHNIEPIAGYAYEKIWRPAEDWRVGLGYTVGFTARQDYHYYPIPLILPLASLGYGRFTLQSTYIPGGKGNGNVLFTWGRWAF